MTKISCDVCMDLMPLVKDMVASQDSTLLVKEHIKTCEACSKEYYDGGDLNILKHSIDDKKILNEIKKHLIYIYSIILLVGTVIGVSLSDTSWIFHNFLIMPVIGAIGYLTLKKKYIFVPIIVFIISYLWFVGIFIKEHSLAIESLYYGLPFSILYTVLCCLGVAISALLKFAFKKNQS